jgi:xylulokinase
MRHWLGLDIGTSAVKGVLAGDAGVVAEASAPVETLRPHPGWSEQRPADWWRAVEAVAADLARAAPEAWRAVAGIGLSGQMHGAVVLDAGDRPLRDVILWNDGRSSAEADELNRLHPDLAGIAGVPAMAGFTAPKLLWLARHEPKVFDAIDVLLLPKDHVRLMMTGERASEMSDAAGTWLLDQGERDWSARLAGAVGLPVERLPRLFEGSAVAGTLRRDVAERWGLAAGLPVAAGAGDAAAGAIGIGAIRPGDGFISLGTSSQLVRAMGDYRPNPGAFVHAFCHALPDRWFQMAAMLNGASAYAWAAALTGRPVGELAAEIEARFEGPSGLVFLPYLTGERTPHNDPDARGVAFGLTPSTDARLFGQAAMEGVAFTLADAAVALGPGDDERPLGFVGGGSRSLLWARMIASILGRPLMRYRGGEKGPAVGAAMLARMAATGEPPEAVAVAPPVEDVVAPEERLGALYRPHLERFRRLYRALAPEFAADRPAG